MSLTATPALKLVVTPILVGGASLAAGRWGAAVAGWLVGISPTSGPIACFLAIGQGTRQAAAVLSGPLLRLFSFALFLLALAQFLVSEGVAVAFAIAEVASLGVQAAVLAAPRRRGIE